MPKGKYIDLETAKKRRIAKEFNVSLRAVYDALNYKTKSKKAMAIRTSALNQGGKVYVAQSPQDTTIEN